jgi:dihydrofolate reductase
MVLGKGKQPPRNIFIAGGGALAAAFDDAGLLDQMLIGVVPVMVANGKPASPVAPLHGSGLPGQVAYLTYQVLADPFAAASGGTNG